MVLAGAVQDSMVLFVSVRRDGRSLGELIRSELGPVPGVIALFGTFLIMTYKGARKSIPDIARELGVHVRLVDEVQYQRRRQKFDFDMMIGTWAASASPGNEQRNRWTQASADQESSFNLTGARSPALDALISDLLAAKTHACR